MGRMLKAFFKNAVSRDSRCVINKERAILLLVFFFIVISVYIKSIDHGIRNGEPHLKDEEGFYGWAELYAEGYYSIPLDEAKGRYLYTSIFTTEKKSDKVDIETSMGSFDEIGKNNDLRIILRFINGTAILNANISVKLQGKEAENRYSNSTDSNGSCTLYNIPMGKVPLEIVIPQDEKGLPLVIQETVDSKAKDGQYNIYASIEVELLSDETLSSDLRVERIIGGSPIPIGNARISVDGREIGRTNAKGCIILPTGELRHALIKVRVPDGNNGGIRLTLGSLELMTNQNGVAFFGVMNDYRIKVSVQDIFGVPLGGVSISVDPGGPNMDIIDTTDKDGILIFEMSLIEGEHVLVANKLVDGCIPPLASGVALVGGEYHYVNHWPPGPSVIISWLIHIGLEDYFGMLIMLLLCFGTWGVARRVFGWEVAALATFLTMTCGITLQLYFGQWMGDLSSTAFAIGGLWLFLVSADLWKRGLPGRERKNEDKRIISENDIEWNIEPEEPGNAITCERKPSIIRRRLLPMLLALISGLLLGASVTMRYSTIVACLMPYIYFLGLSIKDAVTEKKRNTSFLRNFFSKQNVFKWIGILIPLTIGMLIIGAMLMNYNDRYFGGPFNSGYQTQNVRAVVNTDTSGNQTLESYDPPNSFFESYFIWGEDDKENAPYIFEYLLIFVPILYLALPSVWFRRKEPIMYVLLSWVVLTLVVYISQGWVLKRTIEDIRYYSPLVPPCAILGASLLIPLAKTERLGDALRIGKRGIGAGIVTIIVILLVVATVTAGTHAINDRITLSKREPGPGGMGNIPEKSLEIPIPLLLEEPENFDGTRVTIIHSIIDEIIDPNRGLLIIRDDKHADKKLLLKCEKPVHNLKKGMRIEPTGMFVPDLKGNKSINPGEWLLKVATERDIRITTRNSPCTTGDTDEGPALGDNQTRSNGENIISNSKFYNQIDPPPGNKPPIGPGNPLKSMERQPLADKLIRARGIATAGLVLFYIFGMAALVNRRKGKHS